MEYLLRFLTFWLKLLAILLALVLVGAFVFLFSMDSTNISTILSEGMKTRAESVIIGGEQEEITDTLSKFFTWDFLSSDEMIQNTDYNRFVVRSIQHRLKVEWVCAMPWDTVTEATVVEEVPAIDGELPKNNYTEEEEASGEKVLPPAWPHARYKVRLVRSEERWKIDKVELIETIEDAAATPLPSQTPEAQQTPAAE